MLDFDEWYLEIWCERPVDEDEIEGDIDIISEYNDYLFDVADLAYGSDT